MDIEFQNTETDYKLFYKLHYKHELKKRISILIYLPIIIGLLIGGKPFEWSRFILAVLISELLIILALYFIPYLVSVARINKQISLDQSYLDEKKLSLNEDGLYFETATKNGTWKWESISSYYSNEQFIYLLLADKRFFFIPKRAFTSETDEINFLGIIQNEIFKVRGITKALSATHEKPPYLMGLLCLIPFVGAIIGIVLVLYGIFKYKDKWLVIIGTAGLVLTIGVYAYLSNQMKFGEDSGQGFSQISHWQLNTLMKDIEFYKLQNGVYPDSLQQIHKTDGMTGIDDPMLMRKGVKKNTKYTYGKVGDKYYLFSVGMDGIANTPDDIYPTITITDSTKFGLIRK